MVIFPNISMRRWHALDGLVTARGALDRALQLDRLILPVGFKVDKDRLWYRIAEDSTVAPARGLLADFLELRDAAGVLRYAKRWGALLLCEAHGRPFIHTQGLGTTTYGDDLCLPAKAAAGWWSEPLDQWLALSRRAQATLRAGLAIREGRSPDVADWQTLGIRAPSSSSNQQTRVAAQRTALTSVINEWMETGQVYPSLAWTETGLSLQLASRGGLWGAIGIQLAAAVGDVEDLAYCNACHKFFHPTQRAPKTGQLTFCPQCRSSGHAARTSVRAWRDRQH